MNLQRIINKVHKVDVLWPFSVQGPRQDRHFTCFGLSVAGTKGKLRETEIFQVNFLVWWGAGEERGGEVFSS